MTKKKPSKTNGRDSEFEELDALARSISIKTPGPCRLSIAACGRPPSAAAGGPASRHPNAPYLFK
jgi:hypothetical protein